MEYECNPNSYSRWVIGGAVVVILFCVAGYVGVVQRRTSRDMWRDCIEHHSPADCKAALTTPQEAPDHE